MNIAKFSWMPGGWSGIISTTAICMGSTGSRCAIGTCRSWIALQIGDELNLVIAQMVAELSTLHTFVEGGDARKPADQVDLASLGARLRRDEKAGGFVVEHVYLHDPDLPDLAPPLAKPESLVREGETIISIDGQDLLDVTDERVLLRGKAGTQVLLKVKSASGATRDVLVTPIKERDEARLRYAEWEYSRRLTVEKDSNNSIGYVHLQAMGPEDIEQWAREFYPVYDRQGTDHRRSPQRRRQY